MRILHQFKLKKNNGFAYYLFLLKRRLKRDITQTWEGLERTTGRIENERRKETNRRKELENERRYLREFRYT
jgi:hypothetical protein